jgi:hypothetical protein
MGTWKEAEGVSVLATEEGMSVLPTDEGMSVLWTAEGMSVQLGFGPAEVSAGSTAAGTSSPR